MKLLKHAFDWTYLKWETDKILHSLFLMETGDFVTGYEILKKIAGDGNPIAMLYLANCYYVGKYIENDNGQLIFWLIKAAEAGLGAAQYKLAEIYTTGFYFVEQNEILSKVWYKKACESLAQEAENGNTLSMVLLAECMLKKKDYDKAFNLFLRAADCDNIDGIRSLGYCFFWGTCVKKDYNKACDYFKIAANRGDVFSLRKLGQCYENGYGVCIDKKKSLEYYMKAADKEDSVAQIYIGDCYYRGHNVKRNLGLAIKWYEKAAYQGDYHAQYKLGHYYSSRDVEKAIRWFSLAAEQGHTDSQMLLAHCYFKEKNYKKAFDVYQILALKKVCGAQYKLGICYFYGYGVSQDFDKAVDWYNKSSLQGNQGAKSELGLTHSLHSFTGKNACFVFDTIKLAAEQGCAIGQYWAGWCYYQGKGVERNVNKSIEWYKLAADNGHSGAQFELAKLYGRRQFEKSFEMYMKAACQGHRKAQYCLGKCYLCGRGVEKNYTNAVRWFLKAAEDENECDAMLLVGLCYIEGVGVNKNNPKGFEYILKATEDSSDAEFVLGLCFECGVGVKKDRKKALLWYKRAAENGSDQAKAAMSINKSPITLCDFIKEYLDLR